ncbi:MAG: serine hydrolase domain-containing protein [Phycisphaerales bacterium]
MRRLSGVTWRNLACAAMAALGVRGATAQEPAASFEEQIEAIREKRKLPALAVVVMDGTRVALSAATGVRATGSSQRVTIDDQWHLGSCTKAMTATLAARLVERGKITWEMKVVDLFPALKPTMTPGWDKITLRHLVTNTAGVPADIMRDEAWGKLWEGTKAGTPPREQRTELMKRLVTLKLDHEPGTKDRYSNQNFIVAGHMLETVMDTAWEELVTKEVFTPLGISSGGFGAPDEAQKGEAAMADQPRGHRGKAGAWKPVEPGLGADNPTGCGPAGTARMTLIDWGKFVAAHALGERKPVMVGDAAFLKPETFSLLHSPQIPNNSGEGYAMGWIATRRPWAKGDGPEDEGRVLNHAGSNTMWFCVAWVSVERGFGVLAATNCAGESASRGADEAVGAAIREFTKGAKP